MPPDTAPWRRPAVSVTHTTTADQLCAILAEVSGFSAHELPRTQNVLELGIGSLVLVDAFRIIQERIGVRPSIRRVFGEHDTIEKLAAYVDELIATAPPAQPPVALPARRQDARALPMPSALRHLAFLAGYSDGAASAFNESVVLRLRGPLDVPALERAVEGVARRHDALRARLRPDGQVGVSGADEIPTLTVTPSDEAGAAELLASLCARPFDGDAVRFQPTLIPLGEHDHLLVLLSHALVADHVSLQRVAAELAALYSAALVGAEPEGAALPEPVALEHAFEALDRMRSSPESAASLAWWEQLHRERPGAMNLPTDHARPDVKRYDGARVALPLDEATRAGLRAWASRHGSSPAMAVLTVFGALLERITEGEIVQVGLLGRFNLAHLSGGAVVAGLANPLPLRLSPAGEAPLGARLEAVRDAIADAYDHQDVAFADLVSALDPTRDRSRSALFTVGFDVLTQPNAPEFLDLSAAWVTPPSRGCRYDLHITLLDAADQLTIQCDYSTELLSRDTVVAWLRRLRSLLKRVEALDGVAVTALPLLEPEEQTALIQRWSALAGAPPAHTLSSLVGAQVAASPHAVAVRWMGGETSYAALWARAGQIGAALQAAGVGVGDRVGLCAARTPDLIAAVLGALRAGAAWVPIEPGLPPIRVENIVEDAGISLILTDLLPGDQAAGARLLHLDQTRGDSPVREPAITASDLAYVYFTSGSTGRPKGVAVTHGNLSALLDDARHRLSPEDVAGVLMSTSISFDISLYELFVPLSMGGAIVLATDFLHVNRLPERERITLICAVPSILGPILRAEGLPEGLRVLMLGGEAIWDERLLPELYARHPDLRAYNAYGPTETAVYSMMGPLSADAHPRGLGAPVRHTHALVLDRCGQVAPPGTNGELLLGGAGVSRGYIGRPDLTAERFVQVAPALGGGRMYRTGDVVRVMADGALRYLGRADNQIKLRGHRVELGAIEAALREQPGVTDAVAALMTVRGEPHLVGFVCGPAEGVERGLRELLPSYAVPSWILSLPELPRLASGKVNRAALPLPEARSSAAEASPPVTTTQQLLADIWRRELGIDAVGLTDDFFSLGGTSLRMTSMMLTIRRTFQVEPRLRAFFDHPTLGGFAAHLDAIRARDDRREPSQELRAEERFAWLVQDAALTDEETPQTPVITDPPRQILMTGATGFVGVHILAELLSRGPVTAIALIRGRDEASCRARLMAAAAEYGLADRLDADRVVVVPGGLDGERFGLDRDAYDALADRVDAVYHGAAMVNFIYPYHALKAVNVDGTRAVLRFAFHRRRKPVHYVSTAAIWPMGGHRRFAEHDPIDHNIDLNMGYDESKWVAEKMLAAAAARGLPVSIYRPGEVAGHSQTGQSVEGHFLFAMFKGCLQLGAFPRLGNWLDLSPVDYVAEAIAHLMLHEPPGQTFHTTNPGPMRVPDLYLWMRHIGYEFEELDFEDWKRLLLGQADLRSNALYPYASLIGEFEEQNLELPQYDCRVTAAALAGTAIRCAPVAPPLLSRYVDYLVSIGFLDAPPRP